MDEWMDRKKRVVLVSANYYIKNMAAEENVLQTLHL